MKKTGLRMKFLPYEHIEIKTGLRSEEVLRRLDNAIEPKRYFRLFESSTKPYQGSIEGMHFEISRIIRYRNSFLPLIKGDVHTEISGSSISITMKPHILVIVFMIFWLGVVGLFFLGILYALISSLTQPDATNASVLLFPIGMLAFGYALFLGGFKFESIKSKNYFRELFRAKEIEEL